MFVKISYIVVVCIMEKTMISQCAPYISPQRRIKEKRLNHKNFILKRIIIAFCGNSF